MLSESSCIPGLETMITVRPGSHVHRLITVLGLAGEYPVRSLGVLGNERTLRALVSKLSTTTGVAAEIGGMWALHWRSPEPRDEACAMSVTITNVINVRAGGGF